MIAMCIREMAQRHFLTIVLTSSPCLSIVKKIVEEHGGQMELVDAPVFENNTGFGAEVKILFFSIEGQVRPKMRKHKRVA